MFGFAGSPVIQATLIVSDPRSLRLVLDTNVWLDWLVFDDAGVAPIRAAVACGEAEIVIDARCEGELARVLAYPLRKTILTAETQNACLEKCRNLARMDAGIGAPGSTYSSATCARALPNCRDPDDQKFLELARNCDADFLITKDHALLELTRRKIRTPPFCIVTPGQFNNRH